MYNPSRLFSSGRQAERRRLFRLVHGVPLQGTRYSRLWRRKKRFMILVSSFLGPCLPRIFGRSTSPVSTWNVLSLSLHEFLANARDRWKQLSQPGGGMCKHTTVQSRRVIIHLNDSSTLVISLVAFRETVRSERSIEAIAFAPIFRLPALDQFLTALKRGMEKEYFLPRLLFLFEVCLLRDKVECIKSNVVLVLG